MAWTQRSATFLASKRAMPWAFCPFETVMAVSMETARMDSVIGDQLAAVELVDSHGVAHRLAEAWAERPAVLVFVRHFG